MHYMLLIYGAEKTLDRRRADGLHGRVAPSLRRTERARAVPRRVPAPPGGDGRDRPRAGRPDARHRRPVRRDDRATGRATSCSTSPTSTRRSRSRPASRRSPRERSRFVRSSPSTGSRRHGRLVRTTRGPRHTCSSVTTTRPSSKRWGQIDIGRAERGRCIAVARLNAAGVFLSASPLHPAATATCVRVRDGQRVVTDGPFAETHEVLGGYYLILAESRDEAIRHRGPAARSLDRIDRGSRGIRHGPARGTRSEKNDRVSIRATRDRRLVSDTSGPMG